MYMKSFAIFLLIGLVILAGLFVFQTRQINDGRLHVVFCDVGQGDAVYIRTPGGSDMLFDGGPDQKVLGCLTKHMPFWEREFDIAFLSHPHADHLLGLIDVMDRYSLIHFATEALANDTPEFRALQQRLKTKKIDQKFLYVKDRFVTKDGVTVRVLGPSKEYLSLTSPDGKISSSEFASLILKISYKDFDLLLTGDSQAEGLLRIGLDKVDVLQVPHHGSRTGLTSDILSRLRPKLSVISVGKNRYGHPAKETLELLQGSDTKILRTDREGDIEIVSDGKTWSVR